MGDRLRVDTDDLSAAGNALRYVKDELSRAEDTADDARSILGHDRLADRVSSFASNWDDRRKEMLASIGGLGDVAAQAGKIYEEIERELVSTMTEQRLS